MLANQLLQNDLRKNLSVNSVKLRTLFVELVLNPYQIILLEPVAARISLAIVRS